MLNHQRRSEGGDIVMSSGWNRKGEYEEEKLWKIFLAYRARNKMEHEVHSLRLIKTWRSFPNAIMCVGCGGGGGGGRVPAT